ncbi:hypothetical protein M0R45_036711 [Rubus argutus]|uniref:Uncharacterized protein n=1 Tax=Rubus argutus TaxID=59490 RepID=A0AAW1W1D1_RUBAR
MFGTSTPFGGSQSAFGPTSTPPFGATSLPFDQSAFGTTSTPPFDATSSQAFGGTSTPALSTIRCPAFGSTGATIGASSTQVFISSSFPFSTPTISAPGFSSSITPSFGFPSPPAFDQSNSTFGTIPFGALSPSVQSFPFGVQATTPTFWNTGFGHSAFGGQRGGSRVTTYTGTLAPDSFSNENNTIVVKLMSISAMPFYIDKSHEKLRYEDYHFGDKGDVPLKKSLHLSLLMALPSSMYYIFTFRWTESCWWEWLWHLYHTVKPLESFISSCSKNLTTTETGFGTSSSAFNSSSSSRFWPSTTTNRFTPPQSSPSVFELFGQTSPPSILSTPAISSFIIPAPSSNSMFNFNPTASISQTGGAFG